jgi:hypothetical protein
VAKNFTDLVDGTLAAPISIDEFGTPAPGGAEAWTGTHRGGGAVPDHTCADWTTQQFPLHAMNGRVFMAEWQWTEHSHCCCNGRNRLYCFEQ